MTQQPKATALRSVEDWVPERNLDPGCEWHAMLLHTHDDFVLCQHDGHRKAIGHKQVPRQFIRQWVLAVEDRAPWPSGRRSPKTAPGHDSPFHRPGRHNRSFTTGNMKPTYCRALVALEQGVHGSGHGGLSQPDPLISLPVNGKNSLLLNPSFHSD